MKPLKIRMEHFLLYLLYVNRMENLKLFCPEMVEQKLLRWQLQEQVNLLISKGQIYFVNKFIGGLE